MSVPWPRTPPTAADRASYADAAVRPFWLDPDATDVTLPDPAPPIVGTAEADLCVVGGGFTGLWAALHAKREDPSRDVLLLEAQTCGFGASGRNGGFCVASLTHGIGNGHERFPDELATLERLGLQQHEALIADLERHGVDADLERTGELTILLDPAHAPEAEEEAALLRDHGHDAEVLDVAAARRQLRSPVVQGALADRTGAALVHPGKLALGLRAAALRAGVRIAEHTPVDALEPEGSLGAVALVTPRGRVRARRVLLATNAYGQLLPAVRRRIVPVYDYVLMTEPLRPEQRAAIGWEGRQGIGDWANRFHYFRLTRDDRILWGGYDAVHRFGNPVRPSLDDHDPTFARLAQQFFVAFPQLRGLRFTHRWGGAIDTCSRFSAFFALAHGGRVSAVAGYTGLGVGASRFGAQVALDLLDGRETEATALRYVRERPVPFPPEPLRWTGIAITRNRLAAADRTGRRGLWLRALDRLGLGFDS
ncbi:FAD-binding oxidoreductase [Patulibacter brassicae]|jgi:glycine/D-amino acid oxidase-like deaminating enzyme|uniref:FAD-binding oxidoreductase n=1 Tax=Patulibacter brassicae TaxID=1705717 RepID=A0ABU4VSD8_9ACTN|nr:FAD-binding oxidoreductase [Patulibacter brassicae]MDX8153813.1 FAD-binding oxidoreductase [Patulibacter brassicae]